MKGAKSRRKRDEVKEKYEKEEDEEFCTRLVKTIVGLNAPTKYEIDRKHRRHFKLSSPLCCDHFVTVLVGRAIKQSANCLSSAAENPGK